MRIHNPKHTPPARWAVQPLERHAADSCKRACDGILILKEKVASLEAWRIGTKAEADPTPTLPKSEERFGEGVPCGNRDYFAAEVRRLRTPFLQEMNRYTAYGKDTL